MRLVKFIVFELQVLGQRSLRTVGLLTGLYRTFIRSLNLICCSSVTFFLFLNQSIFPFFFLHKQLAYLKFGQTLSKLRLFIHHCFELNILIFYLVVQDEIGKVQLVGLLVVVVGGILQASIEIHAEVERISCRIRGNKV